MPVIISFTLLVIVCYYFLATGPSSVASFIPWSSAIRGFVTDAPMLVQGSALAVSIIGFFTAGISVLLVRGKTLVVGGKRSLIVFTVLFLVMTILLALRFAELLQPMIAELALRQE